MGQVIQLPIPEGKPTGTPRKWGSVRTHNGNRTLYVRFRYHGRRIERATGLEDTPANRANLERALENWRRMIDAGTFRFAKAFPNATEEEKALFARLEGSDYRPDAEGILFGEYLDRWFRGTLDADTSEGRKRDYRSTIDSRIRGHFGSMTFAQITGPELKRYVVGLKHEAGKHKGKPLSGSRVRNILSVLRSIFEDACEEYGWKDLDPFTYLMRKNRRGRFIAPKRTEAPDPFRPEELRRLLAAMDPYYRPIVELMVLTGAIASELAGVTRANMRGKVLRIRESVVRGRHRDSLKTVYREREIPITEKIRKCRAILLSRSDDDHPITMKSGIPFDADNFRKNAWTHAVKRAGLPYRKPYTTRHTFAAWSLIAGVHPERLVRLMGHGSKKMVYEIYGRYVEGIELDAAEIREYMGADFR